MAALIAVFRDKSITLMTVLAMMVTITWGSASYAHNVTPGDAGYIQEIWGVHIIPFMYLGAKHMVTGYDHILFLFGVIFFLYNCLLYTSPSPRDGLLSRMPSSA